MLKVCGQCVQQQEQASPSRGLGGGHSGADRGGMGCPTGRRAQQGLYPEVSVSSLSLLPATVLGHVSVALRLNSVHLL